MHGAAAIDAAFARAKAAGRATFMPYWMLGYPDLPTSIAIIKMMVEGGADMIEIGIPFSDPVADGVVIQAAAQTALAAGATLPGCIAAIQALRGGGARTPFVMMGYVNPFIAYGMEKFTADAAAAGADGFIIPDLPPDEAGEMLGYANAHGLALIELLAPTSSPERIKLVAATAQGFIYLVSVAGVTGTRSALPPDLGAYIARVRASTAKPLAVGFGVSTPEHAAKVGELADGVIVASALIRAYDSGGMAALKALLDSLRAAC
jgi:tryptophan synthase alpha chain